MRGGLEEENGFSRGTSEHAVTDQMTESSGFPPPGLSVVEESALREVLGYANYSAGKPDLKFQSGMNTLFAWGGLKRPLEELPVLMRSGLAYFGKNDPAFANAEQALGVIELVFTHLLPRYREFHRDLLFHLKESDWDNPFLLARFFEAALSQGGPWNESERIVAGAIRQLNDFIGHRPVAVLESGREMQPYEHERFRPVPLYLSGVGTAWGPYRDLLDQALKHLRSTPEDILADSHFQLSQLEELALDPRSYDHQHPMYKRTNYMFGEWDPHQIDISGKYTRFILRSIVLDALFDWIEKASEKLPREAVIFEASAVLCGTILMASTISGSGPNTYDSETSLSTLLPKVAGQRDAFYSRLLESLSGDEAVRVKKESKRTRQPFGHVRQSLNLYIANRGAAQVQYGHLAYLYARMGYPAASRAAAAMIPALSVRFESEIECCLATGHLALDRGDLEGAARLVRELEDLLERGIHCGALMDPWNVLGFQGYFPLFHTREDAVNDPRVERLMELTEQVFAFASRVLSEGAAVGTNGIRVEVSDRFKRMALHWDRYATATVSDVPQVKGEESWESAVRAEQALTEWHAAGESSGDISFWRNHVGEFESVKSFALALDVLLRKHDRVASMGLLMQWLSQAETFGLESGPYTFHGLIQEWMRQIATRKLPNGETLTPEAFWAENWPLIVKCFDYLEANAGEYWEVPNLETIPELSQPRSPKRGERAEAGEEGDSEEEDSGTQLYRAAYEDVVYRDSSEDGVESNTMDGAGFRSDGEFDLLAEVLEPRMHFQMALSRLWQFAASGMFAAAREAGSPFPPEVTGRLNEWLQRIRENLSALERLAAQLASRTVPVPEGNPDSLMEFDRQSQLKYQLLNQVIQTQAAFYDSAWLLVSGIAPGEFPSGLDEWARMSLEAYQSMLRGDVDSVRKQLGPLMRTLSEKPLLYTPLDKGGDPAKLLEARRLQSVIQTLLRELPRLGLFRETWHLLKTVRRMEQRSPREGTVITEFDRLFTTGLKRCLEYLILSSDHWTGERLSPEELVSLVGELTDNFLDLWLEHSSMMRLSSVEAMSHEETWESLVEFITRYGGDFFQAPLLTFGNLRAILQNGTRRFLDYQAENLDPLNPPAIFVDADKLDLEEVVDHLELVFQITLEKYDRFLEYNTTTTHSDYGEEYFKFLDFLRLEASYERQSWNLSPLVVAHQVLSRMGRHKEAGLWRSVFRDRTRQSASEHLKRLKKLETQYGMQLPGITDLLKERFVKPLSLDKILALVQPVMSEARLPVEEQKSFPWLEKEIQEYLKTSSGSGVDVPVWLQALENEVEHAEFLTPGEGPRREKLSPVPFIPVTLAEFVQQLKDWEKKPKGGRRKKPDSRAEE